MAYPTERKVRASRNLLAGVTVCTVAAAVLAAALWLAPFAGFWLAVGVVFIFPVPTSLGLAIGFVSPRRSTIFRAPAYATFASAILIVILTGSVGVLNKLSTRQELIMRVSALTIAFSSALLGQAAAKRGWSGRAAVAATSACVILALMGYLVAEYRGCSYQRAMLPQVLLDVDTNYFELDRNPAWRFERAWRLACYQVSRNVEGKPMVVYASTDSPRVLGLHYEIPSAGIEIKDIASAQTYLRKLGFRERLVEGLARDRQTQDKWIATLGLTRLTLSANGSVVLEPYPPFDAR